MRSYNIDRNVLDKSIIKNAITFVCLNKHKKNGKETKKFRQAQRILKHIDKYVDITYDMIYCFLQVKEAEENNIEISQEIIERAYKPAEPVSYTIRCDNGKIRKISCVPLFPDQIIHQIVIMSSIKVLSQGMYSRSCASIPKRGTHYGAKYIKRVIQRSRDHHPSDIKFVAQLDVKKCYPHIRHDVLKALLRKKFRGKHFIYLCYAIIDSYNESPEGEPPCGIPIGFYTSQWFCNLILTPVDHYIKEKLHVKYYVRYMDDMTMFHRNKKELHKIVQMVIVRLKEIELPIKENWQVYRFSYVDKKGAQRGRAIDALGYRFFRNKTIMRKRNALKLRRAASRIYKKYKNHKRISVHEARSLISRMGALRHCNSLKFYNTYIKPYIKIKKIKEIIANESRKLANATKAV